MSKIYGIEGNRWKEFHSQQWVNVYLVDSDGSISDFMNAYQIHELPTAYKKAKYALEPVDIDGNHMKVKEALRLGEQG